MARQRIRVQGRDASLVAAVAAAGGVGAVVAGPSPTGSSGVDAVLVFAAAAGSVWAAASAPWWAGVVAAGIAAALAPSWWLIVVAASSGLAGLWIGSQRRSLPWSRAVVATLAVQVLARLGEVEQFGLSAVIALVTLTALSLAGIRRRPRRERKVLWAVLA